MDVSADADPNTGAAVYTTSYTSHGWLQVGGTSLAAPLVASVIALAGGVGNTLGNSLPYANLNYGVNLHDVTSGSNGSCGGSYLCTAMAGYDGPTGLGSPLGLEQTVSDGMVSAIRTVPSPAWAAARSPAVPPGSTVVPPVPMHLPTILL